MEMEYTRAFTFPPEDPAWRRKWAVAGVAALIPVVGQIALAGYGVEVTRRVLKDEALPLPEWGDFADYFRKGMGAVVLGMVYWLPLALGTVCLATLIMLLSLAGRQNTTVESLAGLLGLCLGALVFIYAVAANLLLTAALGEYAATDQITAGLRMGEIFRLVRAKPGLYGVIVLVGGLGTVLLTLIGLVACLVGAAWGSAYAHLAYAHLTGQAYRYAHAGDLTR